MRLAWSIAFLCALPLAAQDRVRIEGVVLDDGTGYPIAGAKVVLTRATFPEPLDNTTTDASGAFHFAIEKAGSFAAEVRMPGFLGERGGGPSGVEIDESAFDDGAKPTVHTITVRLIRSGNIVGHVRDGDTAQPMANLTVRALRLTWLRGNRRVQEERIAFGYEAAGIVKSTGADASGRSVYAGEHTVQASNSRQQGR